MVEKKGLEEDLSTRSGEGIQQDIVDDNDKEELRIGLWGTVGSGKTTYLAMLYEAVLKRDGFRIEECDEGSIEFVSEVYEKIARKGIFPKRTSEIPNEMNTYSFRIYRDVEKIEKQSLFSSIRSMHTKSAVLTVMDAGGEWYRKPGEMLAHYADKLGDELDPITSLAQSAGIVCLLDTRIAMGHRPDFGHGEHDDSTDQEFFESLRRLFIQMKRCSKTERGYVKPHIALCLSKVDFGPAWPHREQPEVLIHEFFQDRVREIIINNCRKNKVKWFGVSAVGTVMNERGEEVSAVNEKNEIRNPAKLSPYNLLEPIGWLLYRASGDEDWLVK